ncbi:MAG: ribonuclease HII [Candidatus Bipolaricaulis sp.]|nr:ribonuclease HII [Candidatus Bipolaricaulis sp.]
MEELCRQLLSFDRAQGAACDAAARLCLVGFDEAGRGAWAGPVAVGCVHLPVSLSDDDLVRRLAGVDDSKRLSAASRARLFVRIAECAPYAVGFACAAEIDRIGIVPACRRAAARAYRRLGVAADLALFDRGLALEAASDRACDGDLGIGPAGPLPPAHTTEITHGDGTSLHIAAASIVAKVSRDAWMERLDRTWPGYGLARHKGYGTKAHREGILVRGPSRLHRRTYLRGVREANL